MNWIAWYLIIGLLLAIISYYFHRRDRTTRGVKKMVGVGVYWVVLLYALVFPLGVIADMIELLTRRKSG